MQVQLTIVVVSMLVGGLLGWRATRWRRKSMYDEQPLGMSGEEYARREHRRHLRRRVWSAVLYGLIGAAAGYLASLYLHVH